MYFRDVFLFSSLFSYCNRYAVKFVGQGLQAFWLASATHLLTAVGTCPHVFCFVGFLNRSGGREEGGL